MTGMHDSARSNTVYAAIELSKKSWVVAMARPDRDRPSIHRIAGGNLADLIGRLRKAAGEKQRIVTMVSGWRVRWQKSGSTVASSIRQASKSFDGHTR
jgi:transposase